MDRYIAGSFLRNFALLLALIVLLIIFVDLSANADEFTERPDVPLRTVLSMMLDFYSNNIPLYFHHLGGPLVGIAAAFTFAMMLRNNELTALIAAGVPLQRLTAPVLIPAIALTALWFANAELVLPANAHKIARRHDDLTGVRTAEIRCARDKNNVILSAQEFSRAAESMKRVFLIEPDPRTGRPAALVRADKATWDGGRRVWVLELGKRLVTAGAFAGGELGQVVPWEPVAEYPFTLTPDDLVLQQSAQWTELMSMRQMTSLAQTRLPSAPNIRRMRDIRFTQPLLILIMLALSCSYFLTSEPANVLVGGARSLLMVGSCFAFAFFAHNMAADSRFSILYTASPVLVFGPIAVVRLSNLKT